MLRRITPSQWRVSAGRLGRAKRNPTILVGFACTCAGGFETRPYTRLPRRFTPRNDNFISLFSETRHESKFHSGFVPARVRNAKTRIPLFSALGWRPRFQAWQKPRRVRGLARQSRVRVMRPQPRWRTPGPNISDEGSKPLQDPNSEHGDRCRDLPIR